MKEFKGNMFKDIDSKKKELEVLKQKEEEVKDYIEQLIKEYNTHLPNIIEASGKINKLPFETLKELFDFELGEIKPYKDMINLKMELEQKREKELSRLNNINSTIKISKIDILLSEIDKINSQLD